MERFGNYIISDKMPKEGERVICIQKTSVNYGKIEVVTKIQAELGIVDTQNWKLIVDSGREITPKELNEFRNNQEVVFASFVGERFGEKINKKLVLTLSGGFKVYNNEEVILENMNEAEALRTFNLL